jgi:hypothetical protein
MFRTKLAKAVLIPAAFMIPVSVGSLALTSAAGASVRPAVKAAADTASCKTLKGTVNPATLAAKGTLSGCTPTAVTDGTGAFSGSGSSSSATITWGASHGVTSSSFTYTISGQGSCPTNDDEIVVSGAVTKSTGKAKKIKAGQPLSADVCYNTSKGTIALLKGTTFDV